MAINKNTNNTGKEEKRTVEYVKPYILKVLKAKEIKDRPNCYRFNLLLNGMTINGMQYVTYTSKNGEEKTFISFPQYKGTDDKYYNICYFPINDPAYSKEYEQIEFEIGKLL